MTQPIIPENIPPELKERRQWLVWRYETSETGKQTKVPYNPTTMKRANVVDPTTWTDFFTALEASRGPGISGIGFVLTASDPYTIIDLDNKPERPATEEELRVFDWILQSDTYVERSPSGLGYHVVCKGKLDHARKRGAVEMYSQDRYMAFTGHAVKLRPINEGQEVLDHLAAKMPSAAAILDLPQDADEILTDAEICEMATNAKNGAQYLALCNADPWLDNGKWDAHGSKYTSQSEADLALMSMICFYTRNDEQARRLFRCSKLGRRDKAMENNVYLNRTLKRVRGNEDITAHDVEVGKQIAAGFIKANEVTFNEEKSVSLQTIKKQSGEFALWPPGMLGQLARYFFATARRPAPEIATVTAISLCAAICARNYNISESGLNQYILLLGETGTGKESMQSMITRLIHDVRPKVPDVSQFVLGPGTFASGQGLLKYVQEPNTCFLSIMGEFGFTLRQLSDQKNRNSATEVLYKAILDLFGKSGWTQILTGSQYSMPEKSTQPVNGACLNILGESTPTEFWSQVDAEMISSGLIPRFHVIECKSERVPRNKSAGIPMGERLFNAFCNFAACAYELKMQKICVNVPCSVEAEKHLDDFDTFCDNQLRDADNTAERQLWNRAHLKALRLAALCAVTDNAKTPVVDEASAIWAIQYTMTATQDVLARVSSGDVGKGDAKQLADMRKLITEYFRMTKEQLEKAGVEYTYKKAGCIPYRWLQQRLYQYPSFSKDMRGAQRCLQNVLSTMQDTGELVTADKTWVLKEFGSRARLLSVSK
jgi:hypothetical protein